MNVETTRFLRLARYWFDDKTVATFFEPLIADWQHDALNSTTRLRRFSANVRGGLAYAAVSLRLGIAPPTSDLVWPASLRIIVFTLPAIAALLTPAFGQFAGRIPITASLIVLLLPSALAIIIPFWTLIALDAANRETSLSDPTRRRLAIQLTIAMVLLMVVVANWVTPLANQASREYVFAALSHFDAPLSAGPNEMTLSQLFALNPRPGRTIFGRLMLISLPAILVCCRQAVRRRLGATFVGDVAFAAAVIVALDGMLVVVNAGGVLPSVSWNPNREAIVLIGIAWTLISSRLVPTSSSSQSLSRLP